MPMSKRWGIHSPVKQLFPTPPVERKGGKDRRQSGLFAHGHQKGEDTVEVGKSN